MANNLDGMRVAILATDYFEQIELTEPRKALDEAGAETVLISPKSGELTAFKHDTKGDRFPVDMELASADPQEFDALLLPGGALNADNLRIIPEAQQFARAIDEAGKPIAVICHGAWLLVSADMVEDRRMTSYHTIQDDIRNAGAEWVDEEVVREENWVSSRQPDDIPAFNREMIELFAQSHANARRAA
jgi:protease I